MQIYKECEFIKPKIKQFNYESEISTLINNTYKIYYEEGIKFTGWQVYKRYRNPDFEKLCAFWGKENVLQIHAMIQEDFKKHTCEFSFMKN